MVNILNAVKLFGKVYDWDAGTVLTILLLIQIVLVIIEIIVFATLIMRTRRNRQERVLTAISLDVGVVQRNYIVGDELNVEGLVVTAHYNSEPYTQLVEEYEVEVPDMSVVGQPSVVVNYCGTSASYAIMVSEPAEDEVVATETPESELEIQSPAPIEVSPDIIVANPEPIIIEEESQEGGTLRYDRSFTARLIQSDDEVKHWYTELKNNLLSYNKVKDRMSWKRETYKCGKDVVARLAYRGNTLCLYLALNPADFIDSRYKVEDASENSSYIDTPCMYRLKNERRIKYALELIATVMEKHGSTMLERESVDYYVPYEGIVELINKGLVKRDIKTAADEAIFGQNK